MALYGLPRGRSVDLAGIRHPLLFEGYLPSILHWFEQSLPDMECRRAACRVRVPIAWAMNRQSVSVSSFIPPALATLAVLPVPLVSTGPVEPRQSLVGTGP